MPVRSTKLASIKPPAVAVTTAFTVPAGMTYLVKDVLVFNSAGAGDIVSWSFQDAAGLIVTVLSAFVLGATSSTELSGWWALNAGDLMTVKSSNGTSTFWVSGTKLPGIA